MPLQDKPGNGYHINIYAEDREGNDVAAHVAAGILEKIRDITLFLNPAEESYTRLGNSTAPDQVNWSDKGASELMYVEEYLGKTRAELRSPDASCNPYLVFALLIYAGLSGVERKLTLPKIEEGESASLPASRKEAAKLASRSEFVRSIVPAGIIREYTQS